MKVVIYDFDDYEAIFIDGDRKHWYHALSSKAFFKLLQSKSPDTRLGDVEIKTIAVDVDQYRSHFENDSRWDESLPIDLQSFHEMHQSIVSADLEKHCLLYTSPSPRDGLLSRMPSSA